MGSKPTARSRRSARITGTRGLVASIGGALVVLCTMEVSAAVEDPRDTVCMAVRGMLVPACNASLCNQGKVTGDIAGLFVSKVTSIYPAGAGWIYTGWMRIELDDGKGRIETANEGVTPFDSKGGPDLGNSTEVLVLTEATGAYQDYSGTLVIAGAHALGRPTPYIGRLCHHGIAQ